MAEHKNISMHRKLLGYSKGNKKQPVFAPMPGALVTQTVIHCSQCRDIISPNMGPHRDTWCIQCTEKEAIEAPKREERKREELKKEASRKRALKKAAEIEEIIRQRRESNYDDK